MRRIVLVLATSLAAVLGAAPARAQNPPVTVSVDANASQRPIDPRIYGVNFGIPGRPPGPELHDQPAGAGRRAPATTGSRTSDNRAKDFFFESIPYFSATPGEMANTFVTQTKAAGAEPMITIPTSGGSPRLGPGRSVLCSFSVARYGPQTAVDPGRPDCGNGDLGRHRAAHRQRPERRQRLDGRGAPGGWVQDIVGTFGPASAGGGLGTTRWTRRRGSGTSSPPGRASRGRAHGRGAGQDDRLRRRGSARWMPAPRSWAPTSGTSRGTSTAGSTSRAISGRASATASTARTGQAHGGMPSTCPTCSASSASTKRTRACGCSTCSRSTTTRRGASSRARAGRRGRQHREAAPAQPLHPVAVGPELRGRDVPEHGHPAGAAAQAVGGRGVPGPGGRDQRVQLGGHAPHQRGHRAGGRARDPGTRRRRHGRPLGHAPTRPRPPTRP